MQAGRSFFVFKLGWSMTKDIKTDIKMKRKFIEVVPTTKSVNAGLV